MRPEIKLSKSSWYQILFSVLQKMRAAPTSGTLPGSLMTSKLVAELPIKQSLGCVTEAGHGIISAPWLECGWIHRPFNEAFQLPVRCDAWHKVLIYKAQSFVLQRSFGSLFITPSWKQNRCLPCSHFRRTILLKDAASACGILHVVLARTRAICALLFQMLSSFLIWKWLRLQFGSFSRLCLTCTR